MSYAAPRYPPEKEEFHPSHRNTSDRDHRAYSGEAIGHPQQNYSPQSPPPYGSQHYANNPFRQGDLYAGFRDLSLEATPTVTPDAHRSNTGAPYASSRNPYAAAGAAYSDSDQRSSYLHPSSSYGGPPAAEQKFVSDQNLDPYYVHRTPSRGPPSPYANTGRTSPYPAQGESTSNYPYQSAAQLTRGRSQPPPPARASPSSAYLPPPSPSRTPTDTSSGHARSSCDSGLLDKLKNLAPGKDVAELLNSPPPGFHRQPPQNASYAPFEPTVLISKDKELSNGFPPVPPPSTGKPHPFATHDVTEQDWSLFLRQVQVAASLSPGNKLISNVAPIAMHMGVTGFLVTRAIEKRQKNKRSIAAGELIDQWNHYFFHPRQMDVVLAQGNINYSGPPNLLPADMASQQGNDRQQYRDAQADSSSESDSDSRSSSSRSKSRGRRHEGRAHERRDERKRRREEKKRHEEERKKEKKEHSKREKEKRREKRQGSKERKNASKKPWRLVISFRAYGQ